MAVFLGGRLDPLANGRSSPPFLTFVLDDGRCGRAPAWASMSCTLVAAKYAAMGSGSVIGMRILVIVWRTAGTPPAPSLPSQLRPLTVASKAVIRHILRAG